MDQQNELKDTFIEEYESACFLEEKKSLKSALILFSKALFALCDYIIFVKYKKLSQNHTERFRILELKEKFLFDEVDAVWSKYTDTYSKPSNEDSCKLLQTAIRRILDHETICAEIKKILAR